jgi:hypothetical protein
MNKSRFEHRRYEPGPEVDSFYHLRGCDLTKCACAGPAHSGG